MVQRVGIFRRVRAFLFGEPDVAKQELKAATNHGAAVMALARAWSMPLMVFFSIGALVTLGQAPLEHNLSLWQHGQPLDWVELAGLAVTVVFVIGMDLAMIVGSVQLRDARTRGAQIGEMWPSLVIVLSVAALESGTFIKMVAGYENPSSGMDWILLVGRGLAAPAIAIFLSLAGPRPITRKDIEYQLQLKAGEGLLTWVQQHVNTGQADAAQLFQFFALVNGATLAQREADGALLESLRLMAPASIRAEADKLISAAQHDAEAARAALAQTREQSASELERAQSMSEQESAQQVVSAMLHLVTTGTLPAWMIEQHPELDGLDFGAMAGRKSGTRQAVEREPRTEAERQRKVLKDAGIESPVRAPSGKQGVWISSSDVEVLTGGKMSKVDALSRIKLLPGSAQSGRQIVGRFAMVMEELYQRNLLTDDARNAYDSLRNVSELDAAKLETSQPASLGSARVGDMRSVEQSSGNVVNLARATL